jgi:hypothetical protein
VYVQIVCLFNFSVGTDVNVFLNNVKSCQYQAGTSDAFMYVCVRECTAHTRTERSSKHWICWRSRAPA